MDEVVQLFDERNRPSGTAPRSRVRAENLRHGATGVVVRDSWGRIYVHRRTDSKDVYPGLHDCCAGGVMLAGEDPDLSARREIAEELGVVDGDLRRIGVSQYADAYTCYVAFQYEVTYDGPIRWQPEEVAWGTWMSLDELAERLTDPGWPFVPDSRALIGSWVAERAADRVTVGSGRHSDVSVVEGRWVDRVPRRPEGAGRLAAECRLLPRLAAALPLQVPMPRQIADEPPRFRHPLIAGDPVDAHLTRDNGLRLGRFLRALHDLPSDTADHTGIPGPDEVAAEPNRTLHRFGRDVLPRLPGELRGDAEALLQRVGGPGDRLVHGDLDADDVRCADGLATGVIGWSGARVGDPAVDLAWALYGSGEAFAAGLAQAYGPTEPERARARDWHRLGPWHDVIDALESGRDDLVESGIREVIALLRG